MTPNELFQLAGENGRGGKTAVARWTGLTNASMTHWTRLDRVPAEHCKAIEGGSNGRFPRHLLRPDLWDDPKVGEQSYHNEKPQSSAA